VATNNLIANATNHLLLSFGRLGGALLFNSESVLEPVHLGAPQFIRETIGLPQNFSPRPINTAGKKLPSVSKDNKHSGRFRAEANFVEKKMRD